MSLFTRVVEPVTLSPWQFGVERLPKKPVTGDRRQGTRPSKRAHQCRAALPGTRGRSRHVASRPGGLGPVTTILEWSPGWEQALWPRTEIPPSVTGIKRA
jgi:hypothetical protein